MDYAADAYTEIAQRIREIRIESGARDNSVRTACGKDLEHIAECYGITRLIMESDVSLRDRVLNEMGRRGGWI